jgi:hypothetical protein
MWASPPFFLSLFPRGYPDPFSSQCQLKSKLPQINSTALLSLVFLLYGQKHVLV